MPDDAQVPICSNPNSTRNSDHALTLLLVLRLTLTRCSSAQHPTPTPTPNPTPSPGAHLLFYGWHRPGQYAQRPWQVRLRVQG
eukprot:scaffold43029_cov42-Phaeocystis_antarctica.AAC.2